MLLAIPAVISFTLFKKEPDYRVVATLLGVLLSLFYFLQKQRLEEMKLFREIFEECNKKYDALNKRLGLIVNGNNEQELTLEERQTLIDYFNLCGEEYLYYQQGYILPSVWDAWHKGMSWYFDNERISRLWQEEIKTESYYDFSL